MSDLTQLSDVLKAHLEATKSVARESTRAAANHAQREAALRELVEEIRGCSRQLAGVAETMQMCRRQNQELVERLKDKRWGIEKIWIPIVLSGLGFLGGFLARSDLPWGRNRQALEVTQRLEELGKKLGELEGRIK